MTAFGATPVEVELPSDERLAEALAHALAGEVEVVERLRIGHYATFPNELVTVSRDDETLRLFCKYGAPIGRNQHRHRGGPSYEAAVYRDILSRVPLSLATYYGDFEDSGTGARWLFLAHLEGATPYSWVEPLESLLAAARWIGGFHQATEAPVASGDFDFLNSYDREYYTGWLERTVAFAVPVRARHPWLEVVPDRFGEAAATLLDTPQVVIHGEYYPKNVLFLDGEIYPVDWESTALAAGEIDLAMILDRWWDNECWSEGDFADAVGAYRAARWPEGEPAGFEQRLAAAKLYVQLRWLGDRPEWTTGPKASWRLDAARAAAADLGLV